MSLSFRLLLNEFAVRGDDCSFLIELLVVPGFLVRCIRALIVSGSSLRVFSSSWLVIWFVAACFLKLLVIWFVATCLLS